MGREKARKPRKPEKQVPRIVDMPNVSAETKKNVVFACIAQEEVWPSLRAMLAIRYGEFTVEECDLLDLPAQARADALNDLTFYASAQIPVQAPIAAREAAVRTAANCRQALDRLLPLVEQLPAT
ncbi:hypothetical protein J7E93_07420 [Streptomyces sp. ISL-36]|uniref:hypothetical protein n=1 Tax=Streptomyces sp. ISL-36 TaxID=2819182 RepID=UPI001BEBA4FE|nr:hypothetical protein [Streptomyces sp. ISL-36]MBT2439952.1 hypothetical protein [Streptomyces sp. ISL-36]